MIMSLSIMTTYIKRARLLHARQIQTSYNNSSVMERCILLEEAANSAARKLGYPLGLKEEQLQVVVAFLLGRDVFAVLPTGFGKSLCYACLPYAFQEVESLDERPIVVVVTPLTSIMKDQVYFCV